jgi:predicted RNase H-like nuclease
VRLLGVDGCEAGWVVASSDGPLDAVTFAICDSVRPLVDAAARGALVLVDVLIGLPETRSRNCDVAARWYLGKPRSSSVFPAPHRTTLDAASSQDASELNRIAIGTKVSKQTYAILPKIRAIDAVMTPGLQNRVREAHPEVSFAAIRGSQSDASRGLEHNKREPAGVAERLHILATLGIEVDPEVERARLGPGVRRHDLIDAAVCLVSAWRLERGLAIILPGAVELDANGLRMEIVA